MERIAAEDLAAVVARARDRAARTGELRPVMAGSFASAVPGDVADFAEQILRDGSFASEVERIGRDDPDLADR
jgi:hypothetical protein